VTEERPDADVATESERHPTGNSTIHQSRWWIWLIVAVVVLGGVWWWQRGGANPAAKAGGAAKPAAPTPTAQPTAQAAPTLAPGMADQQIMKLYEPGSYEVVPHDNVRKIIARRLVEAKQTIPHFYLTVDCEIDALLKLRGDVNAAAPFDMLAYRFDIVLRGRRSTLFDNRLEGN